MSQIALGTVPSFQGLGTLPGYAGSYGMVVSGDGSVVAGFVFDSTRREAFRWTRAGGMVALGTLPGLANSVPLGISADGATVVGSCYMDGQTRAFRWTEAEGMQNILWTNGLQEAGVAAAASADGSVIVGSLYGRGAYRWSKAEGWQSFCGPETWLPSAGGISADGAVIVGGTRTENGETYRWTAKDGVVVLGCLKGYTACSPSEVSSDGSVIVGVGFRASGMVSQYEAYRWTQSSGIVGLGALRDGASSIAYGVSGDGTRVVGWSDSDVPDDSAFIWDAAHGMRKLSTMLSEDCGLDVSHWRLAQAMDISADGNTIVGMGFNPSGHMEAWVAVLPEPGAVAVLAVTAVLGVARPRCRQGLTAC